MKLFVGELTTGRKIIPIPALSGSWDIRRNRAGSLSCDVVLSDVSRPSEGFYPGEDVYPGDDLLPGAGSKNRDLDLRNNAAVGRSFLAVAEGDRIFAAGPIWDHTYDSDSRRLHIEAEGMWSMLMRRFILPVAVETVSLLITAGDDAGKPNPAVATVFTGKSWPFIVKGILQQGFARANGALPIIFGADGTGAHDKSYDAASFKSQGEAVMDLTELADGPEVEFRPFFNSSLSGVEWLAMVGDDTQPEITSVGNPHRFDFTAPKGNVRGLKVKSSARELSSEAWATGGRQAAVALISRAASDLLTAAGYPRFESLSNAHSTVSEQSTLDAYAQSDLALGSHVSEWWEWETRMGLDDKGKPVVPDVSSLWLGDRVNVILRGNPYLPDGPHARRIAALSGSIGSPWVKVTTDAVLV